MNDYFRIYQPEISSLKDYELEEPEVFQLENGIKVYQYDAGSQDLVRIELIFNAGSRYQRRPFSAMAANLMLREGTSQHNAAEIAGIIDFYGAYLETSAEKDNAYVSLFSLNKHLSNTLPLLAEIVKNAVFPEEELTILLKKQRQSLVINQEKVNYLARTRFNAMIFGKQHPYGAYITPEEMDGLHRNDLVSFYRNYYHSGNCAIFVAGKIIPGTKEMLQKYFGGNDWKGPQPHHGLPEISPAVGNTQRLKKEGALQSAIRIGKQLFNRKHPDFTGMRVLNTLLGGYFGSRLMRNLREDKGFTYGIGSAVIPLRDTGLFFITCEVGAGYTEQAIEEINKELRKLATEPVSNEELNLVKNYMSGTFLRSIDGPFAMADTYRSVMEDGLDTRFIRKSVEEMQSITPGQLLELAQRYLDIHSMSYLVVGPES